MTLRGQIVENVLRNGQSSRNVGSGTEWDATTTSASGNRLVQGMVERLINRVVGKQTSPNHTYLERTVVNAYKNQIEHEFQLD